MNTLTQAQRDTAAEIKTLADRVERQQRLIDKNGTGVAVKGGPSEFNAFS